MNNFPLSVIVPVYNAGEYFPVLVDSILAQTFRDFELILVDDGSTDDSPKRCDAYAAQDERVRVIHKANGGVSSARNRGIEVARGEYVFFSDSDDYLYPECLETMLREMGERDLLVCDFMQSDRPTFLAHNPVQRIKEPTTRMAADNPDALRRNICPLIGWIASLWRCMYKRSIIVENNCLFEDEEYEDVLFNDHYLNFISSAARTNYQGLPHPKSGVARHRPQMHCRLFLDFEDSNLLRRDRTTFGGRTNRLAQG